MTDEVNTPEDRQSFLDRHPRLLKDVAIAAGGAFVVGAPIGAVVGTQVTADVMGAKLVTPVTHAVAHVEGLNVRGFNHAVRNANGQTQELVSAAKKGLGPLCENLIGVSDPSKKTTTKGTTTATTTSSTVPHAGVLASPKTSPSKKIDSANAANNTHQSATINK